MSEVLVPSVIEADARRFNDAIYHLAIAQHGRVARWQLLEADVPGWAVDNRVRNGLLVVVRDGVYSLGTPQKSWEAAFMTAALAAGRGSVISHRSAAVLHRLFHVHEPRVHVTVPFKGGHAPPDLSVHHSRSLRDEDVMRIRGIPVTSLERTVLDLAETEEQAIVDLLVHELQVERRLNLAAMDAMRRRNRGRHGLKPLNSVLGKYRARAKRDIQMRLYKLAIAAGFPTTKQDQMFETPAATFELDVYWPALGLCLEADGYLVHNTGKRFVTDRRKDRALWLAGVIVHRYTWEDVTTNADATLQELKAIRALVMGET